MENSANISGLVSNSEAQLNSCPSYSLQIMPENFPKVGRDFYIQVEANIGHLKIAIRKDFLQNTF